MSTINKKRKNLLIVTLALLAIIGYWFLYTAPERKLEAECRKFSDNIVIEKDEEFQNAAYKGCLEYKSGPAWLDSLKSN